MFTKGDYIMSGLFAIPVVVGCIGIFTGQNIPAKAISGAMAAVFLFGIIMLIVMKAQAWSANYVTDRGMRVKIGKLNNPIKLQVQAWEERVYQALTTKFDDQKAKDAFNGLYAIFHDKPKMNTVYGWVVGYADGKAAIVGLCGGKSLADPAAVTCVAGLFRHEVSHNLFGRLGVPWDEATHNALQKELGL